MRSELTSLPRSVKRLMTIAFDVLALSFAIWFSYTIRYGYFFVPDTRHLVFIGLGPLIAVPIFIRMGLYRSVIRYLPERAIWTIFQAMTLAALAWIAVIFLGELTHFGVVPRSVPLLYWLIGSVFVAGSRFAAKSVFWAPSIEELKQGQMLIYGAGEAGVQLALALRSKSKRLVAGFVDDNPALFGRDVAGIRVYSPASINTLISNFGIREIVLCIPSANAERRREIVASLTHHAVKVRTLPPIGDLLSGNYVVSQVREIDIDDLLGRSSVPADRQLLAQMIAGRSIMVTGAGGSIGSELCRLITEQKPRSLVLFEQNEFALYNIDRRLSASKQFDIKPVLASVTDEAALRRALLDNDVEIVFHAAAHKHVPLVEANVFEGIRNNVFGSLMVTRLAFECGVENFVLISSDKAVRPTNVMGATKRWAELVVRDYARRADLLGTGQKFCAVRFGNVLGSNGSVVPLFKEQIAAGGPVTITDDRMTRYFMSIHEAAELIVQAGALSRGGDIFLLEMGEPIFIRDLARNMIQLAGHTVRDAENPKGSIEIKSVGMRPGEKLYEELFYDDSNAVGTQHPKILMSKASLEDAGIEIALARLKSALDAGDEAACRRELFELIDETATRAFA